MIEAILIDVHNKTVTKVTATDFDDLKRQMGCEIATLAVHDETDGGHVIDLYVDDEGLFKENKEGFVYKGFPQTLLGSGAIMQADEEGESAPLGDDVLEYVRSRVTFTTMLQSSKDMILSTPPTITTFDTVEEMLAHREKTRQEVAKADRRLYGEDDE